MFFQSDFPDKYLVYVVLSQSRTIFKGSLLGGILCTTVKETKVEILTFDFFQVLISLSSTAREQEMILAKRSSIIIRVKSLDWKLLDVSNLCNSCLFPLSPRKKSNQSLNDDEG